LRGPVDQQAFAERVPEGIAQAVSLYAAYLPWPAQTG
jgi:hypothetical protein